MRKETLSSQSFLFAAGALVFLLTACTLFTPSGGGSALKPEDAEAFAAGIRFKQGDAAYHYRLGGYLQERKKHAAAIDAFRAALEIDPAHVMAHNALGVSHDALGNHAAAVEAYTAALRVDPNCDYVLNNLGYSYLLQGRADLAIAHFEKALALDGGNARYHNNLGLALARIERYEDALAAFKESGDEAGAHRNIARLYYNQGRYREAQAHFAEARRKATGPESEKELSAAGALAEILAPREKAPAPFEAKASRPPAGLRGGSRTIPPEALKPVARFKIVQPGFKIVPLNSAAASRSEETRDMREAVLKMMEQERFAKLNETQAAELAHLKASNRAGSAAPRIKIEVANGNGVRRMARKVGDYLRDRDLILMYLSNAPHFNHLETTIYYAPDYLHEAYRIAQKLPGRQKLVQVPEVRGGHAEISILIGSDLVPHSHIFDQS
jgi:Flp pilus assembly protein TadD